MLKKLSKIIEAQRGKKFLGPIVTVKDFLWWFLIGRKNPATKKEPLYFSQLGQDLWVLKQTRFKKNGYFVEVGAGDGIFLSNSYALEKNFRWRGICIDPVYGDELEKNRLCHIEKSAIFTRSGMSVVFTVESYLSGIKKYFDKLHTRLGSDGIVTTLSLHDLLKKYHAPKHIDYLSIDTEGSEYEIIKDFPFNEFNIYCITIEHNANSNHPDDIKKRENIKTLLKHNGYAQFDSKRFIEEYSGGRLTDNFEDWYLPDPSHKGTLKLDIKMFVKNIKKATKIT